MSLIMPVAKKTGLSMNERFTRILKWKRETGGRTQAMVARTTTIPPAPRKKPVHERLGIRQSHIRDRMRFPRAFLARRLRDAAENGTFDGRSPLLRSQMATSGRRARESRARSVSRAGSVSRTRSVSRGRRDRSRSINRFYVAGSGRSGNVRGRNRRDFSRGRRPFNEQQRFAGGRVNFNARNNNSRGGGGFRRGGRGRFGFGRRGKLTKEQLDKELDEYMATTKSALDKELDEMMNQRWQ